MGVAAALVATFGPSRVEPAAADAGAAAVSQESARRSRVAVTVGSRTVTVGELEDRLGEIPPFQMATLGATRADVLRAYLDQVVVRDMLLAAGAEQKGLDKELPTSHELDRARSNATLRALRKQYASPAAVPAEDVKRYYEENRSYFDAPERINVWRILTKTRDEANAVIDAAKREPTTTKYEDLAREHSIDKATNLRGGNLGFLAPDGTSNQAGLKADPALVKAAQTVKDGEIVAAPVSEGDAFAVVWRRATVPPSRRSLEDATPQIRTTLYRQRTEAAEKKLIDDLRAKDVKNVDYTLLGIIELPAVDAGLGLSRGAARAARPSPPASPRPDAR